MDNAKEYILLKMAKQATLKLGKSGRGISAT
jgi:hypothetical protein